jgi:hypothetical protein
MQEMTVQIPRDLYSPPEVMCYTIFAITFPTLNILPALFGSTHKNIVSSMLPSKLTRMEMLSSKRAGCPANMVTGM